MSMQMGNPGQRSRLDEALPLVSDVQEPASEAQLPTLQLGANPQAEVCALFSKRNM